MAQNEYYPEDVLVGKMQSGEYGWLDYVNHFSADWQEEYARYCEEKGLAVGNESAAEFVRFKDEQLEAAMERRCVGFTKSLTTTRSFSFTARSIRLL